MARNINRTGNSTLLTWAWLFYLLCFTLRGLEYLWLRTNQGVLGKAVWHKLAGIALLALALCQQGYGWRGIGMSASSLWQDISK